MTWTDHAIFWQVYPLGFTGAPIRPGSDAERTLTHRLGHLSHWLDHVVELGCNGLLLGPVFAASTHGYDTLDYYRIDPRLGDDDDFDGFIASAHARGIKVVLDGVFNHVGSDNPLFLAALASPDAPENALFRIDWSSGEPRPADFEGHGHLVALNHASDAVADLVADVMLHWLRRGADGWRLDAAYAVPPEFWAKVLPRVRAEFGDTWILGEMIHGDYAGYVAASGIDSVTQYELWKATWSSLTDVNFFELDHALERHNALLDTFVPQTFVGNHDVTRIATKIGPRRSILAAVVQFTVAGVPSVYAGDEEGFTGTKRDTLGGDDDIRPYFPLTPGELSPLGLPMRRLYLGLVALRRQHPWLVRARTETVELTNERYMYDAVGEGGKTLRVELDAKAITARISAGGVQLWAI